MDPLDNTDIYLGVVFVVWKKIHLKDGLYKNSTALKQ
jgi:hypothetical protein